MSEYKAALKELKFGFIKYSDPAPKEILASTTLGQLLAVPYKDSDAGSNPREFQGMKSTTNKKILQSLLKNHKTTFWALHSGVTITATNGQAENAVLQYDDACLTNGLQTVTIARILTLVKVYQLYTERQEIHTKINRNMEEKWRECIHASFPADVSKQLLSISLHHVNSILNWLHHSENTRFLKIANEMSLSDILDTKVSFKAVLLDKLADFVGDGNGDGERDLEMLGNRIAEANNETQKVDAGDLFGTGNREWLNKELFSTLSQNIKIEYRRFEEDRAHTNQKVIHVLDLLRAILPTTFIIDPKPAKPKSGDDVASFVAGYANMREPIYNWFTKIIRIHQTKKHPELQRAIVILRHLMPDLTNIMTLTEKFLIEQRKALSFDRVSEWTPLNSTSLSSQIFEDDEGTILKKNADSEIRRFLSFSFANVFPMFVFATRTAITVADDLSVKYKLDESTVSDLVEEIYKNIAIVRLQRTLGSTSNLFRDPSIYRAAAASFRLISKIQRREYVDYTARYRTELTWQS